MGIELKTTRFDPRDAGQLGFYVTLVDDRLSIRDKHQPTVGILLVASAQVTQAEAHMRGSPWNPARSTRTLAADVGLPLHHKPNRHVMHSYARSVVE